MAKLRDIKNRIGAVGKTRKITRTMEMVSTSKMRRWQNLVVGGRPYAGALKDVLRQLSHAPEAAGHPLMEKREPEKKVSVLFITSNRGLCGAFNINICREARTLYRSYMDDGLDVSLMGLGKKGISFFRHQGIELDWTDIELTDSASAAETVAYANSLAARLSGDFLSGAVDRVMVCYAKFVSAGTQQIVGEQLLPIVVPGAPEREERETDFIFEPSAGDIVDTILPLYVNSSVYRILTENITSEQAARRKAMKQATDNADEMITTLTRKYNRERQAQITKELSEIVGGADALEG